MINNKISFRISRTVRAIAVLLGLTWVNMVSAETAYVTDVLQLELYETLEMTGQPLKRLRSGDSMEIVQREGRYARVRLEDGETGWVKSLYLVDKAPARAQLNKLENELSAANTSIVELDKNLKERTAQLEQLQNSQQGSLDQGQAVEDEIKMLRIVNADLQSRLNAYAGSVPITWLLITLLAAIIVGAYCCWYYIDRRSRARHGGYRVY